MVLDDLLHQRQADAGTRIHLPAMQALEDHEDLFGELLGDADAVIRHGQQPLVGIGAQFAVNHDARRPFDVPELDRVAD